MTLTSSNRLVKVIENLSDKASKMIPDRKSLINFALSWKVILAEFTSTMLLIFLGCMSCIPLQGFQSPLYASFGFGFVVLFNIQAFAHISGAHMNPAVTVAAVIWGRTPIALGIGYIIAQCAGAVAGYGILMTLSPVDIIPEGICLTRLHTELTELQAFGVEAILTAALNLLNCAIWDPQNKSTLDSVSLKFGFTIAGLSIAGGPLTGASMNPARSLGPALWTGSWDSHWVYWAGPLFGGILSALLYKCVWLKKSISDDV